jgi:hypothetical protein
MEGKISNTEVIRNLKGQNKFERRELSWLRVTEYMTQTVRKWETPKKYCLFSSPITFFLFNRENYSITKSHISNCRKVQHTNFCLPKLEHVPLF